MDIVTSAADKATVAGLAAGRILAAASTGTYGETDITRTRAALRRSGARPSRRAARALLNLTAASAA